LTKQALLAAFGNAGLDMLTIEDRVSLPQKRRNRKYTVRKIRCSEDQQQQGKVNLQLQVQLHF